MASLTLKNVPDDVLRRLRRRAVAERRSMTQQAVQILDEALAQDLEAHARDQIAAWKKLAGKWKSDRPAKREIAEIYRARSAGRDVDL